MRRLLVLVLTALGLGAAPAQAARLFAGPGVKLTVAARTVERFRIKLTYVCGPRGGQRVTETLKVRGLAVSRRGTFKWHFEQGPLVIDVAGHISRKTASGTAVGFGDVGAGSSDCGTGTVHWMAVHR